MKKIAIFVLIFVFACGQASAGTLTVALFDLSGSVLIDNTGSEGKESPYNKNMTELKKEINKLGKGDMFIVIGFARKSDVTLLKVTMPRQSGPMNKNLIATRVAAIKKLQENITNRARNVDNTKTDVIGGIYRASRLFEEILNVDVSAKRLIIYSDMLDNENLGLSLKRLKRVGSHKEFLRKFDSKKTGYPNLKNIEVNLFSIFSDIKGINTVETEIAIKELKAFWAKYFTKSGGNLKSFKTSY